MKKTYSEIMNPFHVHQIDVIQNFAVVMYVLLKGADCIFKCTVHKNTIFFAKKM